MPQGSSLPSRITIYETYIWIECDSKRVSVVGNRVRCGARNGRSHHPISRACPVLHRWLIPLTTITAHRWWARQWIWHRNQFLSLRCHHPRKRNLTAIIWLARTPHSRCTWYAGCSFWEACGATIWRNIKGGDNGCSSLTPSFSHHQESHELLFVAFFVTLLQYPLK